jgi:hypothetical protein
MSVKVEHYAELIALFRSGYHIRWRIFCFKFSEHLSQQQAAGKAEGKFCLVKGVSRGIMTGTSKRQRAGPQSAA